MRDPASAAADRDRFYNILAELEHRIGVRRLVDSHGRMSWPRRGVYFFFEPGETRRGGTMPRVVRVGTHAVSVGSKTTLWKRLYTHRGAMRGTGNHRSSIFRLHVGSALLNRADITLSPNTWGHGSSAHRQIRKAEEEIEQAVSAYLGAMPFLWIEADDSPGSESIRAVLERNSIGLLSRVGESGASADPASKHWLGRYADRKSVRDSALWNVRETTGGYQPAFLDLLECCVVGTAPLRGTGLRRSPT